LETMATSLPKNFPEEIHTSVKGAMIERLELLNIAG